MPLEPAAGRAARIARRALALRCPRCGGTKLFSGWFTMRASCALCGLYFERAQGYWVGAIYVNYAVTVTIAIAGYFLLWTRAGLSTPAQFAIWIPFLLLFPLWFFRYSRSLWLALEFYFNPEP
ncbi:MAG TPA: DUF983 domain-containing protein [Candidatus Acidoferrum sp.]|nr:DUF983 domain-containing protein [Candidatus Acidoferrum sp.]